MDLRPEEVVEKLVEGLYYFPHFSKSLAATAGEKIQERVPELGGLESEEVLLHTYLALDRFVETCNVIDEYDAGLPNMRIGVTLFECSHGILVVNYVDESYGEGGYETFFVTRSRKKAQIEFEYWKYEAETRAYELGL